MSDTNNPKGGLWARLYMASEVEEETQEANGSQEPTPIQPAEDAEPNQEEPVEEPSPGPCFPNLELSERVEVEVVAVAEAVEETPVLAEAAIAVEVEAVAAEILEAEPAVPVAEPVAEVAVAELAIPVVPAPVAEPVKTPFIEMPPVVAAPPVVEAPPEPAVLAPCAACGATRKPKQKFCDDCGYLFPTDSAPAASSAGASPEVSQKPRGFPVPTNVRIKGRYEIGEMQSEFQGVCRYKAMDYASGKPVPVIIVWAAQKASGDPVFEGVAVAAVEDEIMPGFDDVPIATAAGPVNWPSVTWERDLLQKAKNAGLPAVIDYFVENNYEFLVEEAPQGRGLWDAWDEPEADAAQRYGWLIQVAEAMHALHQGGGMLEAIRPDLVVISPQGKARIKNVSELIPLPIPGHAPIKGGLYTAPELILNPHQADARAGLYSFGAMIYSLEYLHHTLEEKDFERQFSPKQITDRFPDVHPTFFRLVSKTFVRDLNTRFPTDEAMKSDPTGFQELIKSLDVCRRNFDNVRLDIAAWTTTGMVRTGNEDALAVLHGVEARQDDVWEYAMVLLCDGMGGYEAGEVAAAMAIAEMRKFLLNQPMFAALAGKEPPANAPDEKAYMAVLNAALRHANKEVYTAARTPGKGRRGMGCTAECVYVDPRNVMVGHVGDSRVYHLSQGRLIQLTRDQTLVNRLVELGQLTAEEAEDHPRKNELQQAIGGQPDVAPHTYAAKLKRGDWVLVCSDGLSNHIPNADLEKMLTREAFDSADMAARRLLNLVNLRGATDNATIVVIRAS